MKKLFGTDGVRGVANKGLTPELAFDLGKAGAYVLTKNVTGAPRVLVAKDGRRSGDMLEAALTAGLCSIGTEVYHCGVIPTPAVAYLIKKYNFDAGVMISASHNPMEDNGIKFFNCRGLKLPDGLEEEIESLIYSKDELPRPTGTGVGVVKTLCSPLDDYVSFVLSTVPGLQLAGMKIALDCANGATSAVAPIVFEKLGAEVHTLYNSPDGCNINANCGSTHMESITEFVAANNCDIGLAFDGDGDRMLAVDDKGQMVDGDIIMAICGLDLHERGQLTRDTIVATVMSNQGLEVFCRNHGMTLYRTAVGDRYVLEKMLADNLMLGGEQSGHMIFRQFNTTGDGILAGVQLLSVLHRKKKAMSQLAKMVEIFPQVLINAKVSNSRMAELTTSEEIKAALAETERQLSADERILVRPSGTEPLVRVMLEGRDIHKITELAKNLVAVIEKTPVN
ncbi:MAG: phosphoglucosamine mutase [Firmicutes bacterium]|nr:phosphoglucosamine mutase [Bacillota bacterium]